MSAAKCEFKNKPCPKIIDTTKGSFPVWALIKRLAAYPSLTQERGGERIDTRQILDDYFFKQNYPETIAEIYSSTSFGPITMHPCAHCAAGITRVLQKLKYVKPYIKGP